MVNKGEEIQGNIEVSSATALFYFLSYPRKGYIRQHTRSVEI